MKNVNFDKNMLTNKIGNAAYLICEQTILTIE